MRGSRTIVGHAVRALYLAAGATDIYTETGDEQLLDAMLAQWQDLAASKLYLTGGVGSRHFGESIGDDTSCLPTARTARPVLPSRASCGTGGCCS